MDGGAGGGRGEPSLQCATPQAYQRTPHQQRAWRLPTTSQPPKNCWHPKACVAVHPNKHGPLPTVLCFALLRMRLQPRAAGGSRPAPHAAHTARMRPPANTNYGPRQARCSQHRHPSLIVLPRQGPKVRRRAAAPHLSRGRLPGPAGRPLALRQAGPQPLPPSPLAPRPPPPPPPHFRGMKRELLVEPMPGRPWPTGL